MDEATAYQWAGQCLRVVADVLDGMQQARLADVIASALVEATREADRANTRLTAEVARLKRDIQSWAVAGKRAHELMYEGTWREIAAGHREEARHAQEERDALRQQLQETERRYALLRQAVNENDLGHSAQCDRDGCAEDCLAADFAGSLEVLQGKLRASEEKNDALLKALRATEGRTCEVCFTDSFEPTPEWERCLCCWQQEALATSAQERDDLRQQVQQAYDLLERWHCGALVDPTLLDDTEAWLAAHDGSPHPHTET